MPFEKSLSGVHRSASFASAQRVLRILSFEYATNACTTALRQRGGGNTGNNALRDAVAFFGADGSTGSSHSSGSSSKS